MKQITTTVETDYIEELHNPLTDNITRPIPEVLTFLFTRYGFLDSRRLTKEEDKVRDFSWKISDTPVVFFNLIEDLEIIAEAARNVKSDTQKVNYGVDIVRDTNEFETSLLTWLVRLTDRQTWVNFKTHFTTAHTELSKVRGSSVRGSTFHQANTTVEALTVEMVHIRDKLQESINSLSTVTPPTIQPPPEPNLPTETPRTNQQINAATAGQQAIIEAIQQLQQQMIALSTRDNNRNNNGGRGGGTGNGDGRGGGRYTRTNTSKYCWSYGACAHSSSECNAKRDGYKNDATFANKMGGSTSYCGNRGE